MGGADEILPFTNGEVVRHPLGEGRLGHSLVENCVFVLFPAGQDMSARRNAFKSPFL